MTTPIGGATDYSVLLANSSETVPGADTQTQRVTAPDQFGKDAFMKLLVAQLKYQNPLSPMDGNEFLAQQAQFTMLEKLQEIADGSAEQIATAGFQTAAGLLGKKVTWTDNAGDVQSGLVTGSRMEAGRAILLIGETEVALAGVSEVHLP